MDAEESYQHLAKWVEGCFQLSRPITNKSDLVCGIVFNEILQQCDSNYFSGDRLPNINQDVTVDSNWRLKASNMKKILKGIRDYFADCFEQSLVDFPVPDANSLAENFLDSDLARVLQLIIRMAVNGPRKEVFLQKTLQMDATVQHWVMLAIKELQARERSRSDLPDDDSIGKQLADAQQLLANERNSRKLAEQRIADFEEQMIALQKECDQIRLEKERLLAKGPTTSNVNVFSDESEMRWLGLQKELNTLRDELAQAEASKEEFRSRLAAAETEKTRLQSRISGTSDLEVELRNKRDEADELRNKVAEMDKLKATLDTYKKRLEELSDLRQQNRLLEEQKSSYMQAAVQLEDESKRCAQLRTQLESTKADLEFAQQKMRELTIQVQETESDRDELKLIWKASEDERNRLLVEREQLKMEIEELQVVNSSSNHAGGNNGDDDSKGQRLNELLAGSGVDSRISAGRAVELAQLKQSLVEKEKKIEELDNEKQRYRQLLEKARTALETMESRQHSLPAVGKVSIEEIESLRLELAEKQALLSRLQEENERTRVLREQEQRLVSTAFHNLALEAHRRASDDRLVPMESFLSRQRQIVTRRSDVPSFNSGSDGGMRLSLFISIVFICFIVCLESEWSVALVSPLHRSLELNYIGNPPV